MIVHEIDSVEYPQLKSNFLKVNGIGLHYQHIRRDVNEGRRTTFLLINSLGTDFRIWSDVASNLIKHGDVLLFDKRGHGLSGTHPAKSKLTLFDLTDDTEALLDQLSIEKCIVIGLCVGGMIAQLLASRHPSRVEKMILCDTLHKIGNTQCWNDRIKAVRGHGFSSISGGEMRNWFAEPFRKNNLTVVAGFRNMLERTSKTGYIQTCQAICDADLTEVAGQLKVSTLCVVGSEDELTPPEQVKEFSSLLKNSVFEIIQGSGHVPCVDNAEVLSSMILDFVQDEC